MRPSIGTAIAFSGFTPREMLERKREREAHYYRLYGPQYYGPAWPGFFRGALEWWRIWSVLDADAYWADVELWSIRVAS
jgi:hypothetical protein